MDNMSDITYLLEIKVKEQSRFISLLEKKLNESQREYEKIHHQLIKCRNDGKMDLKHLKHQYEVKLKRVKDDAGATTTKYKKIIEDLELQVCHTIHCTCTYIQLF
jgi:uncharacterized coiled-coil protein SlyX